MRSQLTWLRMISYLVCMSYQLLPVEPDEIPLVSISGKETVDNVTICSNLAREQVSDFESLLSEFSDVLSDVPNKTSLIEHPVNTTAYTPIHKKPYTIPYALHDQVKKEL